MAWWRFAVGGLAIELAFAAGFWHPPLWATVLAVFIAGASVALAVNSLRDEEGQDDGGDGDLDADGRGPAYPMGPDGPRAGRRGEEEIS